MWRDRMEEKQKEIYDGTKTRVLLFVTLGRICRTVWGKFCGDSKEGTKAFAILYYP